MTNFTSKPVGKFRFRQERKINYQSERTRTHSGNSNTNLKIPLQSTLHEQFPEQICPDLSHFDRPKLAECTNIRKQYREFHGQLNFVDIWQITHISPRKDDQNSQARTNARKIQLNPNYQMAGKLLSTRNLVSVLPVYSWIIDFPVRIKISNHFQVTGLVKDSMSDLHINLV